MRVDLLAERTAGVPDPDERIGPQQRHDVLRNARKNPGSRNIALTLTDTPLRNRSMQSRSCSTRSCRALMVWTPSSRITLATRRRIDARA